MGALKLILDFFLNIDQNLYYVVQTYGVAAYAIIFGIIFMETGFVITPFLPGDSLLFAAGAIAGINGLKILPLFGLLVAAAFLGDTVNYWIGHFFGPKIFEKETKLIKKEYLYKAQGFYAKYGGQAIFLARFVPIVRTFAPFVAGIGKMSYPHFLLYNLTGGLTWVGLFVFSGYFFGNLSFVKGNFHLIVVAIVILSITPIIYEWYRARPRKTPPTK